MDEEGKQRVRPGPPPNGRAVRRRTTAVGARNIAVSCDTVLATGPGDAIHRRRTLPIRGGLKRGEARDHGEGPFQVVSHPQGVKDLITNELIDDINKFDAAKIAADAKATKPGK